MLKFTEDHEWLKLDGDVATIGITQFAAQQLGDLVFIQLPDVGTKLAKGNAAAVVESVKAASDVYSPVTGEVIANNSDALSATPELVNSDPYGQGWLFKVKPSNSGELASLLDAKAYEKVVEEAGH